MDKTKSKYKLMDGYNGDVVYRGDNLNSAKKVAREYDAGCEGDWLPLLFEYDMDAGKYVGKSFSF